MDTDGYKRDAVCSNPDDCMQLSLLVVVDPKYCAIAAFVALHTCCTLCK